MVSLRRSDDLVGAVETMALPEVQFWGSGRVVLRAEGARVYWKHRSRKMTTYVLIHYTNQDIRPTLFLGVVGTFATKDAAELFAVNRGWNNFTVSELTPLVRYEQKAETTGDTS